MLRSCRILRAAHKPSIKFPDRKAPQAPHEPHPHPAAPSAVVEDFSHFQEVFSSGPHFHPEKLQDSPSNASASNQSSSSTTNSSRPVFDDLQQLPQRFWKTPSLIWDEKEMEAVMTNSIESQVEQVKLEIEPVECRVNAVAVQDDSNRLAIPTRPIINNNDDHGNTTISSLHHSIDSISVYSDQLDDCLLDLIHHSKQQINKATNDIAGLAPQLEIISDEANVLMHRISDNAHTARRISMRVGAIDEQKRRLDISTRWCLQAAELKSSLQALEQFLDSQDYESAVKHCVSAMSISSEVLNSKFASISVPTSSLPDPPPTTLLSLRKRLLEIFTRGFKVSTDGEREKNQEMATWYFKQFPRIGWRSQGLKVYCDFARGMVRERNKMIVEGLGLGSTSNGNTSGGESSNLSQAIASNPHHFSRLLTMLFENLALLIDMHQPLVDRHYGSGNFVRGVMGGLMEECDLTGGRILRSWEETRGVEKKLIEIGSYRFNHSWLNSNGRSLNSIAASGASKKGGFSLPGRPGTPAGDQADHSNQIAEIEGPDGREVDRILGELAGMNSRWELYGRFVNGRVVSSSNRGSVNEQMETSEIKDFRRTSIESHSREQKQLVEDLRANIEDSTETVNDPLEVSQLGKELQRKLNNVYLPLESWYLRSSIEKAHRLDQPEHSSNPYTSSLLEDVFYVLRSVLSRVLLTSSTSTVSSMIRVIRTTIDEEFVGVLVRRMDGIGRSAQSVMAVDGPRKENASREMKLVFVTYLNVLHTSSNYMSRILDELSSERNLSQYYPQEKLADVQAMVQGLDVLVGRMRSAVSTSLELLFTTLTRPRLRAVLSEAYRDRESAYELNEDGFAEAEYHDIVRRRFVKGWEVVMSGWKDIFIEQNYDPYFSMALEALVRPWENVVMGMRFTELGALRFDKDVRGLSSYLSSQTTSGIRDKFTRLQQISYVLNLDEVDESEDVYENSSGVTWRLSKNEVQQVRRLRL